MHKQQKETGKKRGHKLFSDFPECFVEKTGHHSFHKSQGQHCVMSKKMTNYCLFFCTFQFISFGNENIQYSGRIWKDYILDNNLKFSLVCGVKVLKPYDNWESP